MTKIRLFLVGVVLTMMSCAKNDSPTVQHDSSRFKSDPLLATIAGTKIHESDFQSFIDASVDTEPLVAANPSVRNAVRAEFLDYVVLAAKARQEHLDETIAFKKARELMQSKTLARLFVEAHRAQFTNRAVTEAELRAYYDQHATQFTIPARFTARQILVFVRFNPAFPDKGLDDDGALARAGEALSKLRDGESWDAIARDYSDDTATSTRGGLIENAQSNFFPHEFQTAVWRQPLGVPEIIRTAFGYHVLQVEQRIDEQRKSFDEVRSDIEQQLATEQNAAAHESRMNQLRREVRFQKTDAAQRNVSLLDRSAVAPDEVLATMNGASIRESDFQWFLKDAFRPEQRMSVFSRPGARKELLASFLDMRVMEAKARTEHMHETVAFKNVCAAMELRLLAEFLQERDGTAPWKFAATTDEERNAALRKHLAELRSELGFRMEVSAQ